MRRRKERERSRKQPRKHRWTCPLCDGVEKLDATYTRDSYGRWRWFVGCFSTSCPQGPEYLRALADFVDAQPSRILDDPPRWLKSLGNGRPSSLSPAPLPSLEQIKGWTQALMADGRALRYVTRQRGLTRRTIRDYLLGFDGRAIVIPILDHRGRVLNIRRRYLSPPIDGPKITGLRGHAARLYPGGERRRTLLLCEGEFDVLLARQHGLPALTSTAGTSWSSSWNRHVDRGRIAVLYDAGERPFQLACDRADALVRAGAAEAWAVDLRQAGLANGEDVTDWFLTYNFSVEKLVMLIRGAHQQVR
jgi:hypothetical protein